MKSRSTTLNFSAAGGEALETVNAVQAGIPLWASIHIVNDDNTFAKAITSGFTMANYPCEHVLIKSSSNSMLVSIALLTLKSVLDVPEHELTIDLSKGITTNFNFKYDLGDYNLYVYDSSDGNAVISANDSVDITISENSNFDPILWEFSLNWD